MRLFHASTASRSASLRTSAARSAAARTDAPYHRRRSGTSLDPGGNDRVDRREHCGGDIGTVEISNKIA
jgi:hypothetical protein